MAFLVYIKWHDRIHAQVWRDEDTASGDYKAKRIFSSYLLRQFCLKDDEVDLPLHELVAKYPLSSR